MQISLRNWFFSLLAAAVLCPLVSGQTSSGDEVIRVDTQLVDVPVAVTNASGLPVRGLSKANFVIFEDGVKQDIVDFSTTAEPFEVALLLDTSGSTRNDLQLIQQAAASFIASLRPGDRVAIIAFATERTDTASTPVVRVMSELTGDRTQLTAALSRVSTSAGTPYYDALNEVADRIFRDEPPEAFRGRRAVVALTDGVDSTSAAEFAEVRTKLGQQGVIAFFVAVDTREFFEESMLGDCQTAMRFSAAQIKRYYRSISGKAAMEKVSGFCQLGDFERLAVSKRLYEIADAEMSDLAKNSGGQVFRVADLGEAKAAFKKVADEIGTKYTLGYYPVNESRDGKVRRIRVELKGAAAGAKLRFRESYTAPAK